jgi:hypothetical protein
MSAGSRRVVRRPHLFGARNLNADTSKFGRVSKNIQLKTKKKCVLIVCIHLWYDSEYDSRYEVDSDFGPVSVANLHFR